MLHPMFGREAITERTLAADVAEPVWSEQGAQWLRIVLRLHAETASFPLDH
jgi:hypothetical protein